MASSVVLVGAEQPAVADDSYDIALVNSAIGTAADTVWHDAVEAAINPDDYVCEPTLINQWIGELIGATDPATLDTLFMFGAPDWPLVYKLFFDDNDLDEFIGIDGSYTREHIKRQRDLIRFWDSCTRSVVSLLDGTWVPVAKIRAAGRPSPLR